MFKNGDTSLETGSRSKKYRKLTIMIFVVVLVAELLAAWYLLYVKDSMFGDAMSRTANAYYVIAIEPHKLASIGMVWNPLPSLLQIPLLIFKDVFPPLATHGLAGAVVTAFFAAFNSAYIFRLFKYYRVKTGRALFIVFLHTFNPFMFLYGCNGLSEMPFYTSVIIVTGSFVKWTEKRNTSDLTIVALMLVFGVMCRYEAIPLAVAVVIAIFIVIFYMDDPKSTVIEKSVRMKINYFIATSTIAVLPALYTVLVWIFLNWTIVGDPFYFLFSDYSNNAIANEFDTGVGSQNIVSKIGKSIVYIFIRSLPFIPVLIALIINRIYTRKLLKPDFIILLVLVFVMILFHQIMLIADKSFGWIRFFSFTLPITVSWLPYEFSLVRKKGKTLLTGLLVVAFLISGVVTVDYIKNDAIGAEEYSAIYMTDSSDQVNQQQVAQVINEEYNDGRVLMDSSVTFTVILNIDSPENILTNTNENYFKAVKDPRNYGIRYIVTISPDAGMDDINTAYPRMYDKGTSWCKEVRQIGNYKIFEVLY